MRIFGRALITLAALGTVAQFVPTVAADTQLQALQAAKEDVAAAARHESQPRFFSKGSSRWITTSKGRQLRRLEGELNRLINDLEKGRAVSPAQIDQALGEADSLR